MLDGLAWGWIWYTLHFVFGLKIWAFCHNKMKPKYVIWEHMDSYHLGQELQKVMNLFHAMLCTVFVSAYWCDVISSDVMMIGRAYSIAYFVFDSYQIHSIYNRLKHLGLEDEVQHPAKMYFHHIATILLMKGYMFEGSPTMRESGTVDEPQLTGLVIFYLAEAAMIPVLLTWRYIHINQEASWGCAITRICEIVLYGVFRVFLLPFYLCEIAFRTFNTKKTWRNPCFWCISSCMS